ncbi:MAG: hypothetical protein ABII01_03005 [Candidatus Woesearchaeota archaeon]
MQEMIKAVLWIIVVFIAWNLFFYLLRKRFPLFSKIVHIISTLIFVVFTVLIIFIFMDVKDFQDNFQDSETRFMLVHGNEVKSAIISYSGNASFANESELVSYSDLLAEDNLLLVKGDAFKMFLISTKIMDEIDDYYFESDIFNLTKNQAYQVLTDDNYAESLMNDSNIKDISSLRAYVFSDIISNHIVGPDNQNFFIEQLKSRNIIIFPETIMFKLIRIIPISWIPINA